MATQEINLGTTEIVNYNGDNVKILKLNNDIIWRAITSSDGLIFSGIDENGEFEYTNIITTQYGDFNSNSNYNGTPVAFYTAQAHLTNASGSPSQYPKDSGGINREQFDFNTEKLTFAGNHDGKPIRAVGSFTLTSNSDNTLSNLKTIEIGKNIETVYGHALSIIAYNDIDLILGEDLKLIECYADSNGTANGIEITFIKSSGNVPTQSLKICINCNILKLTHSRDKARNLYSIDSYGGNVITYVGNNVSEIINIGGIHNPISDTDNTDGTEYIYSNELHILEGKPLKLIINNSADIENLNLNLDNIKKFVVNNRQLIFEGAGNSSGLFYRKSAYTCNNIYTNNQYLLDYDFGTDNCTPTIYNLDGTLTYERLSAPQISLSGNILTITPVENESVDNFIVINDVNNELVKTANLSIDLSQYLTTAGTYTITVRALAGGKLSSVKSTSVSYTIE